MRCTVCGAKVKRRVHYVSREPEEAFLVCSECYRKLHPEKKSAPITIRLEKHTLEKLKDLYRSEVLEGGKFGSWTELMEEMVLVYSRHRTK